MSMAPFGLTKRVTRGGPTSRRPVAPKKPKGEDTLERLMEQAKYEIEIDPYRGMGVEGDASMASPWRQCQAGSRKNADSDDDDEVVEKSAELVQMVWQAQCPCLIRWTTEAQPKGKKLAKVLDRPVIGQRPDDPAVRCACDYNPYCLSTLGGVVNEILRDRVELLTSYGEGKAERAADDGTDDDDVEVLEDSKLITWELDPSKTGSIYREETRARLKETRKSIAIPENSVRAHLESTLQGLSSVMSIDDCIATLRKRQDQLIFKNPLLEETAPDEKQLTLSMPCGIENLGATCYLNTQLQCLAQNLVFVEGIFAWQASQHDDRMESVLSLFQRLVAEMKAGSSCKLNTLEFSNALGLDHFEQQDPNEFSRLLFERMHEKFQDTEAAKSGESGSSRELKTLLPELFQGIMTYETTCLTCQATSRRHEEFMDLNLPIVQPPAEKKSAQRSILDALFNSSKSVDTDVGYCLEKYCEVEYLEGDNQYLCGNCGVKRDATRELSFQKLPPVLNVQLSRYVYDRKKSMKKKLSDQVLLPLEMAVESKGKERKEGKIGRRYILCAVMRHQGTSAYSGHYVAEAMDWLTGQWFEFNDEKVTLLPSGPSCSFDPKTERNAAGADESSKKGKAKTDKSLTGSKDAYNMYYVEESFLAQSSLDWLRTDVMYPKSDVAADGAPTVLERIALERTNIYADVGQMCLDDAQTARRMARRRESIRTKVFPDFSSFRLDEKASSVWVEGKSLRRFLSCRMGPETSPIAVATFQFEDPLPLLCKHSNAGLHPRIARRGKLLPREVYEAMCSVLDGERIVSMNGRVIDQSNLVCEECSTDYRSQLASRLTWVMAIRDLLELLDTANDISITFEPGEEDDDDNDTKVVYAVSRKFVTRLRTLMNDLMKSVAAADATGPPAMGDMSLSPHVEGVPEGFDAVDTSSIAFDDDWYVNDGSLDLTVNGSHTCVHGRLTEFSKKSLRFVSKSTWEALGEIFPRAVEHKIERTVDDSNPTFVCHECEAVSNVEEFLRERVKTVITASRVSKSSGPYHAQRLVNDELHGGSKAESYRIVHEDDIGSWQALLAGYAAYEQKKTAEPVEAYVKEVLRASTESSLLPLLLANAGMVDQDEDGLLGLLASTIRPIVCTAHGKPISNAVFDTLKTDLAGEPELNGRVAVLDEDRYLAYLAELTAVLGTIVNPDVGALHGDVDRSYDEEVEEAMDFCRRMKLDVLHPKCTKRLPTQSANGSSESFTCTSNEAGMRFLLTPFTCKDEECNQLFDLWQESEGRKKWSTKCPSTRSTESATTPVIIVDSDIEEIPGDTFSLRVFVAESGASSDAALSGLSQCIGLPMDEPDSGSLSVRRSRRKRTSRYPVGAIVGEDTIQFDLQHNIAALRLFLLERCGGEPAYELDHDLKLVVSLATAESPILLDAIIDVDGMVPAPLPPKVIDLSFAMNDKTMRQVCESALGEKIGKSSLGDKIFLLRVPDKDPTAVDITSDEIMEHLIKASNALAPDNKRLASGKNGNKTTRAERGFSGTLLSSRPNPTGEQQPATKSEASTASDVIESPPTKKPQNGTGTLLSSRPSPTGEQQPATKSEESSTAIDVIESPPTKKPKNGTSPATNAAAATSVTSAREPRYFNGTTPADEAKPAAKPPRSAPAKLMIAHSDDDDSSDDELLKPSPYFTVKRKRAEESASSTSSSKKPSPVVAAAKTDTASSHGDQATNGDDTGMVMALTQLLLNNDIVDKSNEFECYSAAEWAVRENPEEKDSKKLEDLALSKYLEQSSR